MKQHVSVGLSLLSAIFAVLAAAFWILSTKVEKKVPPGSQPGSGWDGYMVGLNAKGEPVHLVETLRDQWIWSSFAAWSAAAAALLQAGQNLAFRVPLKAFPAILPDQGRRVHRREYGTRLAARSVLR